MKIVVQYWEWVLLYRDGRFEEVLETGRHRRPRRRHSWVRVLVRPRLLVVPSQEVLTADGLFVTVSLTAAVRTSDARRWHEAVEDSDAFVYAACRSLSARRSPRGRWTIRWPPAGRCRTTSVHGRGRPPRPSRACPCAT